MGWNLVAAVLFCVFSSSPLVAQAPGYETIGFRQTSFGNVESGRSLAEQAEHMLHRRLAQPQGIWLGTEELPPAPLQRLEPSERDQYERWAGRLALLQGAYYTATGLWPILHMRSFEQVTGPKTDDWLVKTVGGLISVLGGTLLVTGLRDAPSRDLATVALGSAAALAAVDVIYVARGRISPIYLLDAGVETVLIAGWAVTLHK